MIYSRLESEIERIITASGCGILKRPHEKPTAIDFGVRYNDKKIAIEARGEASAATFVGMLGYQVPAAEKAEYDQLWFVTSHPPPTTYPTPFAAKIHVEWISLDQLAAKLGASTTPEDSVSSRKVGVLEILLGQFAPRHLVGVATDEDLENLLKLGKSLEEVTAVFVDIKSFTQIVHNAEPKALSDMLSRYYRAARNTTQSYGGTFDKVVGDAVLSVFNYPSDVNAVACAMKYALDIIQESISILSEFVQNNTFVVDTGVRVGMATGSIRPIDVGQKVPQISFVGDPLNLAARLQHKAETNGIAMCRNTWVLLQQQDAVLAGTLTAVATLIPKGELSGIETAVNCQLMGASGLPASSER